MSKNLLDEILDGRSAKRTTSTEDATVMLTGKDTRSIPKSVPKYTKAERSNHIAKLKAKRDGIEGIEAIDHIPEIPDGFPEGTILNDDQTLSLPDGRIIRKIKG